MRFVRVIRVAVCPVCPLCVPAPPGVFLPCVSRLPLSVVEIWGDSPGVFLPVRYMKAS